jgi:hypothetical protein
MITRDKQPPSQKNGPVVRNDSDLHTGSFAIQPVDQRPETVAQRNIQERAKTGAQTRQSIQLQAMADGYVNKQLIQSPPSTGAVIQREVIRSRKTGKYYSDKDPEDAIQYFDTREEALEHDRSLVDEEVSKLQEVKIRKREVKRELKRKAFRKKFGKYVPPTGKKAIVYKNKDKEYDELTYTALNAKNIKAFMEKRFEERKASLFETQVISMNDFYYVIAPGTDIGLTPLLLRPDLDKEKLTLSREGSAKPYDVLAKDIDKIVARIAEDQQTDYDSVRERTGKDLDRLTRSNPVDDEHEYTEDELRILSELSAVLRLDKGRVPGATKYIRRTFTSRESFKKLLGEEVYKGAGTGGVQRLRGQVIDDGELSEGSDIDEKPKSRNQKKRPSRKRKKSVDDSESSVSEDHETVSNNNNDTPTRKERTSKKESDHPKKKQRIELKKKVKEIRKKQQNKQEEQQQ